MKNIQITLDIEKLDDKNYSLYISNPDAGTEQDDVTIDEIGTCVEDYVKLHSKSLGLT